MKLWPVLVYRLQLLIGRSRPPLAQLAEAEEGYDKETEDEKDYAVVAE